VSAAVTRPQHGVRARDRRRRRRAVHLSGRCAGVRPPESGGGSAAPMRRVVVVFALALLAFPGSAWAHATLEETWPKVGQRLAASPREVRLQFDQSVRVLGNAIQVYDAKGRLVSG